MPLHVLLADDSVPAQNMGKKILVDAGYEVLTCSNGLEALRKIAESLPDIAVLDIFMPGYTGLELCERLRGSAATAALPVILTVGKLEPYRPEDGEKVHSNAIIVKPFAATELVSAVRSLIGSPGGEIGKPVPQVAAPLEAAESAPADPFGDSPLAADVALIPQATVDQELDEPLFAVNSSEAPAVAEPLQAADDLNSFESLAFNPDAKHTPFSASVLDSLPSVSQPEPENGASAFTEFDLEPESLPSYPPVDSDEEAGTDESAHSHEQVELAAPSELSYSGFNDVPLESAIASDEIPAAPVESPLESISTSSEVLTVDPLLELPKDPVVAAVPETAPEGLLEAVTLGSAAGDDNILTESETPLTAEEEARRQAFEALFNSPEPLPLDEVHAPSSASVEYSSFLPSIPDTSKGFSSDTVRDSEIESLLDEGQDFVAPELDPYLIEEDAPRGAIGKIPERDFLLDGEPAEAIENWPAQETPELIPAPAVATNWQPAEAPETTLSSSPEAISPEVATTPELEIAESADFAVGMEESGESPLAHVEEPVLHEAVTAHAEPILTETALPQLAPELDEPQAEELHQAPELLPELDGERVQKAVERVFDRFKPLLVAAIVRELARND